MEKIENLNLNYDKKIHNDINIFDKELNEFFNLIEI